MTLEAGKAQWAAWRELIRVKTMHYLFGCFAALLFVVAGAAAQDRVTVGTATAARGQKATGTIEVPAGVDAALSIPVAVIHGVKPGPTLALVAGAHGTEYFNQRP
jgi:hypothetical protein